SGGGGGRGGGGEKRGDEHVHLVLQDQLLGFGDAGVGLALIVLDDEFHVHTAELAAVFVKVHLEAVDHVLADLREDARHRRDVADAQLFGAGRGGQAEAEGKTTAHQHFVETCRHCYPPVLSFLMRVRKDS